MSIHAQTADVLDDAADYIEKHGWTQDFDGLASGAVCAGISLRWVARSEHLRIESIRAFVRQIGKLDGSGLIQWNDAPGRTEQEVLDTFRAAAKAERKLDDEAPL